MSKKILICGITGQLGSYAAELYVSKGYDVCGLIRRTSVPNTTRLQPLLAKNAIRVLSGDITDAGCVSKIIATEKPDFLLNCAAQSHVHTSFEQPLETFNSTTLGHLNVLESIAHFSTETKSIYLGSSEMFGSQMDADGFQRETTPMVPNSPYAVAKVAAFHMSVVYRKSYKLKSCSAICANMESARRGENFVTRKITKYAAGLMCSINKLTYPKLRLGNLLAKRDWNHVRDSLNGIDLMFHSDRCDDYVISSGNTRSVEDFLKSVFDYISDRDNQKYKWEDYVVIDPAFFRPMEVPALRCDSTKIRTELGWKPTISFESLVAEMVDNDILLCKTKV